MKLFKTAIIQEAIHAAEIMGLTTRNEEIFLNVFERKVIRPKKVDDQY